MEYDDAARGFVCLDFLQPRDYIQMGILWTQIFLAESSLQTLKRKFLLAECNYL